MPPFFENASYRLGLLDLEPRSIAPDSIVERVLSHHRELRLEPDELRALLDLQNDFRREQRNGAHEFTLAGHRVRPTAQPGVPASEVATHLETRAALFLQAEVRTLEYTERVQEVLGEGRWSRLVALYEEETRRELERLGPAIAAAVEPVYSLHDSHGAVIDPNAASGWPDREGVDAPAGGVRSTERDPIAF